MAIDSATQILLTQKQYPASKKGLRATPIWDGYVQYMKIHDVPIGLGFYRELWKKETSIQTPFWVSLHNVKWIQDNQVNMYYATLPAQTVESNHNGIMFIALNTPVGLTLEETAKTIADQVLDEIAAFTQFCSLQSNRI